MSSPGNFAGGIAAEHLPLPCDASSGGRVAPLSYAQRRLWILDRLRPGGTVYNEAMVFRLAGRLNAVALQQSLNDIVQRHEVLRTRFGLVDDRPVQVVATEQVLELEMEDISGFAPDTREAEGRRRAEREAETPFDLTHDSLLRVRLLRLWEDEHWLLLTLHHIVVDGWSYGVLTSEMSVLYRARCRGEANPLPPLPMQYADYAVWQREWLHGGVLERQLAYWKSALAELPTLELPTDRPRPALATFRGARVTFEIGEELTRRLKAICRQERATMFMLLLAAYQVLLYRYSGQEDVAVGVAVAGRARQELEGLIGFFVNTLVLRGDLSGEPRFMEYLARVRARALEAYAHQDVPFDKLVEELHPPRDLSRNPLFQTLLVLQNSQFGELQLEGLEVQRVADIAHASAKFDLALSFTEISGGMRGMIEYSTDLFDAQTIFRLVLHLQTLLEGIAANPQAKLSELPLLTASERQQLLVEWNGTARDYPRELCVHQLFEAQVAKAPDALALIHEGQHLSYADLDSRANRLAHHLRGLGVNKEMLVAICVERSLEMVMGLLGVLKAGAAYVPMDPGYPAERLAFMLSDSGATVVLTQARLVERLPQTGARRVCLDADWPQIMQQPDHPPTSMLTPRNLAYVIYTSGSTGVPKGVAIEHRSLADHCRTILELHQLSATDRVFQFASLSFDASINQILPPLCIGAVVVLGQHQLRDPTELDTSIRVHGVTVLGLPPAFFQLWIRLYGASNPPPETLRLIIQGGDVLSRQAVMAWRALPNSTARLINSYGPTETTIACMHYIVPDSPGSGGIPIGRPLNNTSVYVLDSHLQPVPVGVSGELHVGGIRVARGYLNRPELTAERFIANPFSGEADARLYKTGDLVRYLADGNIEFLGRLDDQVKIGGFRIEPGEIEATLMQHPAVLNAVAQAREAGSGGRILVAFIVKQPDVSLLLQELRDFLGKHLPAHLVPGRIFLVNRLPINAHGKVDRAALQKVPLPNNETPYSQRTPYNALQATLLQIWSGLLEIPEIGINENFFELGGDSYGAVTMLYRVEKLTKWSVPLATIYNNPTVESLAQAMLELKGQYSHSPLVEIQAGTSGPPFFFMHGDFDGGGFYCYQLARFMGPSQAFYAIQPHGLPGRPVPTTIEDMAAEYLALIRAAFPQGPYFLGGHCSGAMVAFEIAQRLLQERSKVGLLVMMDPSPVQGNVAYLSAESRHPALVRPLRSITNIDLDKLSPGDRHDAVMQLYRNTCENYAPKFYPGKLTLFLAQDNLASPDPTLGWRNMSQAGEIHVVPGNHVSMLSVHAPAIARKLVECRGRICWD